MVSLKEEAASIPYLCIQSDIYQENPHEQQQTLLLSRIIENVQKLNEAVMEMNQRLQAANIQTMDVELVAQMFKNYQSNVLFHLEATDNLKEPS
ncbi:DASH complex subunit Dad4-domain-containing protein [Aspergillus terricola var. indicus]